MFIVLQLHLNSNHHYSTNHSRIKLRIILEKVKRRSGIKDRKTRKRIRERLRKEKVKKKSIENRGRKDEKIKEIKREEIKIREKKENEKMNVLKRKEK